MLQLVLAWPSRPYKSQFGHLLDLPLTPLHPPPSPPLTPCLFPTCYCFPTRSDGWIQKINLVKLDASGTPRTWRWLAKKRKTNIDQNRIFNVSRSKPSRSSWSAHKSSAHLWLGATLPKRLLQSPSSKISAGHQLSSKWAANSSKIVFLLVNDWAA